MCYAAGVLLSTAWNTLDFMTPQSHCTSMCMVGLPACLGDTYEAGEVIRIKLKNMKIQIQCSSSDTTDTTTTDTPNTTTSSTSNTSNTSNNTNTTTINGIIIQKVYPGSGDRLYLRLAFACYNTFDEVKILRDVIKNMC